MEKLFSALKKVYTKIPVSKDGKIKLKNTFYRNFGVFFKNNHSYREWLAYHQWLEMESKRVRKGSLEIGSKELEQFNFSGTIAIQLHLFYVDLMDEFVEYFSNMPYEFDLLISIIDESKREEVMRKATAIPKVNQVVIKKVENRGRDVAPLVAVFGKDLLKYDYFCHVHSKKSLFTGNEQMDWRRHLMNHLFGNETLIRKIFYGFEHGDNVGMVYPETFAAMPYWGHAWLQNEKSRDELLGKLGVPYIPAGKYIEYPMGTMFWGRTKALEQFFQAGLQVEDFAEEHAQTDGTIAHAFERCTVPVCRLNGYNTLIYDERLDSFTYNVGRKNFDQYCAKSFEQMKEIAAQCEIVSFDVFDTLVSRFVARPDDAFDMLECRLNQEDFPNLEYKRLRKEAEAVCREKKPDADCDLDDIYKEFQVLSGLSEKECESIKQAEVDNELALIYPKKDMVEFYHYVTETLKKQVFIVTDMYMRRADIEKILEKCGISNYEQLFLSSEMNLRKDDGSFWKAYSAKYDAAKWMHIGDNEKSDMQISGDYKIRGYHILSSADLYECSGMGNVYSMQSIENPATSVAVGLTLKRLFDYPFALNQDRMELVIRDASDFGYAIIAPIILGYMNDLCRNIVKQNVRKVFFFAREGYLLKDLFCIMKDNLGVLSDVDGIYLNVSRRALSMASIRTNEDIDELLGIAFRGSLKGLLHTRFGIEAPELEKEMIQLPEDLDKVSRKMDGYKAEILKKAEKERNNYLNYYQTLKKESDGRMAVSDIGYSGTIQYFLSKLTGETFDGYYFATDSKKRPLAIEGNTVKGYYIEDDSKQDCSASYVHRYHLLLESILIAPVGQFVCVEDDGSFAYTEQKNPYFTEQIAKCQDGIKQYFRDFYENCKDIALENDIDKAFSEGFMQAAVENEIMDEKLEKSFMVEDFYCSDEEISVLELYRSKEYKNPTI